MYVWTAKRNSPRWRKSFEGRVARSSIFLFLVRAWGGILLETESWILTRMWFERRIGLRDLLIEKLIDSTKTMVKPSISFERKRKWNKFSTVKKRKKKKKELSLGFEKFSPIDAKRRYVYTQKKKRKESHCHVQQIIPFFPSLICGIIEGEDISLLVREEGEGGKRIDDF